MGDFLDIADVAASTGTSPSALRYYERRGLIAPVGRHGLRRLYDPATVERLRIIGLLQRVGMTLEEIRQFLDPQLRAGHGWREVIEHKQKELERQLVETQAALAALGHALGCPRADLFDCPYLAAAIKMEG